VVGVARDYGCAVDGSASLVWRPEVGPFGQHTGTRVRRRARPAHHPHVRSTPSLGTPELLNAATHAMAGPLVVARVASQTVAERYPLDAEAGEAAAALTRMGVVVDGLVRLQAAMRLPLVEDVDLDAALRRALVRLSGDDLGPEVVAGSLGTVCADQDLTVMLLAELLANVAAHAGPGQRAFVRAEDADGMRVLSVADSGVGLPATVTGAGRLAFVRTTGPGAGCGLAVAEAIATGIGGRLELTETPGGGATALVHIPIGPPGS
jgi:signal transduction histidine kinase